MLDNRFRKTNQQKSRSTQKKGSKLVELRESAEFTQVELAAVLGVSLTTIQSWEKSGLPHIQKYYKLAQVLGCEIEDLEDREEDDFQDDARRSNAIQDLIRLNKPSKV